MSIALPYKITLLRNHIFILVTMTLYALAALSALLSPCYASEPSPYPRKRESHSERAAHSPLLMAHYMPWFEADPAHDHWGWHWTMNHYKPGNIVDGQREIASHYHPLIGVYASDDTDLLECHVLLMKFAGIDGAIIDWYGMDNLYDYALNHRNVLHLITVLKRAGLRYAICYEDQTLTQLVAKDVVAKDNVVSHGKDLLKWMQTNWFTDPAYVKSEGRPVFMVFGGGYYQPEQWKEIFAPLNPQPEFYTELGKREPAVGAFSWPVPNDGTAKSDEVQKSFTTRAKEWERFIPVAYPRFHDIYQEAGVQKSWGCIEDRGGKTYAQTLTDALKSKASIVQLATWNDWGEGTMIEPSVEFGYRDLEQTQTLRKKYSNSAFSYTEKDLRIPIQLYLLQKKYANNSVMRQKLSKISALLFAGQLNKARTLLKTITAK